MSLSFAVIWVWRCPDAVATSSEAPWAIPDTVVTSSEAPWAIPDTVLISASFAVIWVWRWPETAVISPAESCAMPETITISEAFCVTLVSKLPVAVCNVEISMSLLSTSVRRTPVATWSDVMSLSFAVIWAWRCPEAVATSSDAPWAIPETIFNAPVVAYPVKSCSCPV